MIRKIFTTVISITLIILLSIIIFDNTNYSEISVPFSASNNTLAGRLILPKQENGPYPVVIFVHGDGPTTYDSDGFYSVIWNHLAAAGIASFSWDKAGIGESTGNWLHQNQHDRATEVIKAIETLKKRPEISRHKIGLIGFSQGGWVLPIVATQSDYPDFMILVSSAINLVRQSEYYFNNLLNNTEYSEEQIAALKIFKKATSNFLTTNKTYDDYRHYWEKNAPRFYRENNSPLTADRFIWNQRNWHYDARSYLKNITCPVLSIFGDQDKNVDHLESTAVYQEEFTQSGHSDFTVKIFPDATHSLLKNKHFSSMDSGFWEVIKFIYFWDDSFADGYLDLLAQWIKSKSSMDEN